MQFKIHRKIIIDLQVSRGTPSPPASTPTAGRTSSRSPWEAAPPRTRRSECHLISSYGFPSGSIRSNWNDTEKISLAPDHAQIEKCTQSHLIAGKRPRRVAPTPAHNKPEGRSHVFPGPLVPRVVVLAATTRGFLCKRRKVELKEGAPRGPSERNETKHNKPGDTGHDPPKHRGMREQEEEAGRPLLLLLLCSSPSRSPSPVLFLSPVNPGRQAQVCLPLLRGCAGRSGRVPFFLRCL